MACAGQVEKKHTAPICDVAEFFSFDFTKVDSDLVCSLAWERKDVDGTLILACHDMKGGYLDDKFIDGSNNSDFYNFYHWAQIDLFIYFSHHLVTIPPRMWIEICHRNGIPVLGTLITEWDAGAEKCVLMFGTEQAALKSAEKLVEISNCYGFDGWLINIENKISLEHIKNVQIFLQCLTCKSKENNPNSYILWYDSVTTEGKLHWQDSVNDLNYPFFECCSGIFLNYCWKDWHLQLTMELCDKRLTDVFVGIDVWGRGCVGKFDSYKSVEKIKSYGFSVAIFAPGWCYEQNDDNFNDFLRDNNTFWDLLCKTCPPKPLKIKSGEGYQTNFNYGFGNKVYKYGFLLEEKSWYNISKQDVPFVKFTDLKCHNKYNVSIESNYSFNGSTSIKIENSGLVVQADNFDRFRIAELIAINASPSTITVICKNLQGNATTGINMILTNYNNEIVIICPPSSTIEVGGGNWRQLTFDTPEVQNISWIGIETNCFEFTMLIGYLSINLK